MYGVICNDCRFKDERGFCGLPEEALERMLATGFSDDAVCSEYEQREEVPVPPTPPKLKQGFDAWGAYADSTETPYHDKLDELREKARTRED
jgi:hypothetical protein